MRAQARDCVFKERKRLAAYPLNTQISVRIVGSTDVQLAHLVLERCAFESEALCRSTFAGYSSGSVFQSTDNCLTLRCFERRCSRGNESAGRFLQLRARDTQLLRLRENHAALDEVFKFAN